MMKKLKVVGQNMSAACAANVDIRQSALLPADSQLVTMTQLIKLIKCGVNEGMTLEGGSEKSQIKRTSIEVIVTD